MEMEHLQNTKPYKKIQFEMKYSTFEVYIIHCLITYATYSGSPSLLPPVSFEYLRIALGSIRPSVILVKYSLTRQLGRQTAAGLTLPSELRTVSLKYGVVFIKSLGLQGGASIAKK